MNRKRIAIFSGAGMSAESGISTFRDSNGLWDNYNVMQVAHIDSWCVNQSLMLQFYNERRQHLASVSPNKGHRIIAEWEKDFDVTVITQNIDNLHERAGSSHVIHLHGELTKACSSKGRDKKHIIDIGYNDILPGDLSVDGSQLRPFIVWFGEDVPEMGNATLAVSNANVIIIVGTSMQVYPAANLIHFAKANTAIYLIDPAEIPILPSANVEVIQEKASKGLALLKERFKFK
ncbi:MAG: NAD-dependent deacylase [Candidatus Azobacteroides pseudotrichonymphae]|jgi:NAD-dependent deacetylase|nr:NAD-dependent protein deacylase [Bacteroidales bacterium OttesenSCG-928-I14]GMO32134.1 MAG: NAD-dependent deacylase [Candidatus Azobacteroides pseudotrichonymphae]